jgi:hypothetical protein
MTGASTYPDDLDSDINLRRVAVGDPAFPADHNNLVDAVESVEAMLGVVPTGWPSTDGVRHSVFVVLADLLAGGTGYGEGDGNALAKVTGVYKVALASIPSGAWTHVDLDTVDVDTANMRVGETAPKGLTVSLAGSYLVGCFGVLEDSTGAAYAGLAVYKNGSEWISPLHHAGGEAHLSASGVTSLAVADTLDLWAYHDSSGSINLRAGAMLYAILLGA